MSKGIERVWRVFHHMKLTNILYYETQIISFGYSRMRRDVSLWL